MSELTDAANVAFLRIKADPFAEAKRNYALKTGKTDYPPELFNKEGRKLGVDRTGDAQITGADYVLTPKNVEYLKKFALAAGMTEVEFMAEIVKMRDNIRNGVGNFPPKLRAAIASETTEKEVSDLEKKLKDEIARRKDSLGQAKHVKDMTIETDLAWLKIKAHEPELRTKSSDPYGPAMSLYARTTGDTNYPASIFDKIKKAVDAGFSAEQAVQSISMTRASNLPSTPKTMHTVSNFTARLAAGTATHEEIGEVYDALKVMQGTSGTAKAGNAYRTHPQLTDSELSKAHQLSISLANTIKNDYPGGKAPSVSSPDYKRFTDLHGIQNELNALLDAQAKQNVQDEAKIPLSGQGLKRGQVNAALASAKKAKENRTQKRTQITSSASEEIKQNHLISLADHIDASDERVLQEVKDALEAGASTKEIVDFALNSFVKPENLTEDAMLRIIELAKFQLKKNQRAGSNSITVGKDYPGGKRNLGIV